MSHVCAYWNGILWGVAIGISLAGGIYHLPYDLLPLVVGLFIGGIVALVVGLKALDR